MNLTVILDVDPCPELVEQCVADLNSAAEQIPFKLIICADEAAGVRRNAAAKQANTEFLFFIRPWIRLDAVGIKLMLTALERDLSIACAAPRLMTEEGKPASSEYILIQDECKRNPIDVLLRPADPGRTENWELPPSDGIAFKSDALMVRRTAFWGVGGWEENLEDDLLDLSFGLALKEQQWRCVFVQEAVAKSLRPAADPCFSPAESRWLVERWFGRFIPHGLRSSDGVIRNHPWVAAGAGDAPTGLQHPGGPFDLLHGPAAYKPGDIPGERCSVVVVTYNSMESIRPCVTSVFDTLGTFDEVIFVDNGSRDETPAFLAELEKADPRVKVVLNGENLGFSQACNVGIGVSSGEYVVLLNPDTVVIEGWLGRMRSYFQDDKVGAVGPISNGVCGLQRYEYHLPRKAGGGLAPNEIHKIVGQTNARRGVESKLLIGFCLMLKRSVIDEVGLLDPELFLGCDDLDISWRLRLFGYKLVVATDVFVLHRVHVSFKTQPAGVVAELTQRSCDAFAKKLIAHYGEGSVPSQEELWEFDWFESRVSVWEDLPELVHPRRSGNIRL